MAQGFENNSALMQLLKAQSGSKSPIKSPSADVFSSAAPIGNVQAVSTNPFALGHAVGDQFRRQTAKDEYLNALQQSNLQAGQLAQALGGQEAQSGMFGDIMQKFGDLGPETQGSVLQMAGVNMSPGDLQRAIGGQEADIFNTGGSAAQSLASAGFNPDQFLNRLSARIDAPNLRTQTPTSVQAAQATAATKPVGSISTEMPSGAGSTTFKRDVFPGQEAELSPTGGGQPAQQQQSNVQQTPAQATGVAKVQSLLTADTKGTFTPLGDHGYWEGENVVIPARMADGRIIEFIVEPNPPEQGFKHRYRQQ